MGGKKMINANFKEEITCLESSQYFKKIVEGYDLTSKFTQICQFSMSLIFTYSVHSVSAGKKYNLSKSITCRIHWNPFAICWEEN